MEAVKLSVRRRNQTGKGPARRLRATGEVPAVVYGQGHESTPVSIRIADLREILATHGRRAVLEVDYDGGGRLYGVIKEVQIHPTRHQVLHCDIQEIALEQEIEVQVAVELKGTPPGVTRGGILDHELREVTVRALPASVPRSLSVDVSGLDVGSHATVGDIQPPAGVIILDDPAAIVANVLPPRLGLEVPIGEEPTEVSEVGEGAEE